MARKARVKSSTGIYHVLVRAISDISLFSDSEDVTFYLDALQSLQSKGFCTIYAYALFPTHIHLLISDNSRVISGNSRLNKDESRIDVEPIGSVMKRLASAYAYYFNVKYDHYGPIYLDRFKSEPIEDHQTFVSCLNFITSQSTPSKGLLTTDLPSLITNPSSRIESCHVSRIESSFIDFEERPVRITDSRLKSFLVETYGFTTSEAFLQLQDATQAHIVTSSIDIGANVLQLSRLTGLTRKVITRMSTRLITR